MKYARPIQTGERVRVHKNLQNGLWSVSAVVPGKSWQVIAWVESVSLSNPKAVVSLATVKTIHRIKKRKVCARIEGIYLGECTDKLGSYVSYNPWKNEQFQCNGSDWYSAGTGNFLPYESGFTV